MTRENMRALTQHESDIPIACTLSEEDEARRRDDALAEFTAHVREVNELADGYQLRFTGSPEVVAKLTQFITDERACCSFLALELVFEPNQGPIWLRLRGPEGAKEFMKGMLSPADA